MTDTPSPSSASEAAKALTAARNRKLSPERRSEIASIAAKERWRKADEAKVATADQQPA